jgi:hypothetical protein
MLKKRYKSEEIVAKLRQVESGSICGYDESVCI